MLERLLMVSAVQVKQIVDPVLERENLFLVDITVTSNNKIVVTVDSEKGVAIDSCVVITRAIEASLDREKEDFELEVTSAGLGQPLKNPRQYGKYIDKDFEVLLSNGQKLQGILRSADENGIQMEYSKKVDVEGKKKKQVVTELIELTFDSIKQARAIIKFR